MIYILLIACLAIAGFNTYMLLKKKKETVPEEPPKPLAKSAATVVKQLLPEMNCNFRVKETKEDEELIDFDYQGGHFSVAVATQNEVFKLGFMFFFSAPTEKLERIRTVCNQLNMHTRMTRYVYSFMPEQNQVFVHLFSSSVLVDTMPDLKTFWRSMIESCFEHKRIFLQRYDSYKEMGGEELNMDADRTLYLMREHEIAQQDYAGLVRSQAESPYALSRFVSEAMDQPDAEVHKVEIIAYHRLETITDYRQIEQLNLSELLILGEGESASFKHKEVQLIIKIRQANGMQQTAMVMLQAEKETAKALYFRATYCIPPQNISRDNVLADHINSIDTYSMLMAYDKIDSETERKEMARSWEEAFAKYKENGTEGMSDEQKLMIGCTFVNERYVIQKGHKAFMSKRYYEAIFYLEQAYANMKDHFQDMSEAERNAFYEIVFYLGFCYNDLGLYQKAYYYLDAIFHQNRISYTKEYIISLVNCHDFRALSVINSILQRMEQLESNLQDEEDGNGKSALHFRQFVNFLLKEKGYMLVVTGHLDEAEKLYKDMLKDPENEAIALRELANLERIKKEV